MEIKNGQGLHAVLFGTFGENKYFLGEYRDSFDLIGFNANIIAYAPDGIAAFISQLSNKSYFIDPQTYAFQQPVKTIVKKGIEGWVLKKSISNLVESYKSIIKDNAGKSPIIPGTLSRNVIKEISKNVLFFEIDKIQETIKNLEYWEFLKNSGIELRPEFLIAPYFYLEPDNLNEELEDNIKFIEESREIIKEANFPRKKQIFAEIVLDKDVLIDSEKIKEVVENYKDCAPDGFLIWIDDFPEVSVNETALKKYKDFLIELNKCNKPIINMRGSYFSIILAGKDKSLLAGVGHGIEYGEHREIVPVGGGVPRAKFYFPKFHKRIDYSPDAQDVLLEMDWIRDKQTYFDNVCSCDMCKKIIKSDVITGFQEYGKTKISEKDQRTYPTADAMDKSRKHYLNIKITEYHECSSSSISEIIDELKKNQLIVGNIKSHTFNHLKKWTKVLQS